MGIVHNVWAYYLILLASVSLSCAPEAEPRLPAEAPPEVSTTPSETDNSPYFCDFVIRNIDGSPCSGAKVYLQGWRATGVGTLLQIDPLEDERIFEADEFGAVRLAGLKSRYRQVVVKFENSIGFGNCVAGARAGQDTSDSSQDPIEIIVWPARFLAVQIRDDLGLPVSGGRINVADPDHEKLIQLRFAAPMTSCVLSVTSDEKGTCELYLRTNELCGLKAPKRLRFVFFRFGGENSDQILDVPEGILLLLKVPKSVSLEIVAADPRNLDKAKKLICMWGLEGRNPLLRTDATRAPEADSLTAAMTGFGGRQVFTMKPQGSKVLRVAPGAKLVFILGNQVSSPKVNHVRLGVERRQRRELATGAGVLWSASR